MDICSSLCSSNATGGAELSHIPVVTCAARKGINYCDCRYPHGDSVGVGVEAFDDGEKSDKL